jgi:hypothetical protein
MQTLFRLAAKGFGIALMICGFLSGVAASPEATKAVVFSAPTPFWSRPEVLFVAGLAATVVGVLLNRDRASIVDKIDGNHKDVMGRLDKIDVSVSAATVGVAEVKAVCEATRKGGACLPK